MIISGGSLVYGEFSIEFNHIFLHFSALTTVDLMRFILGG